MKTRDYFGLILIAFFFMSIAIYSVVWYNSDEKVTITVSDKEKTVSGTGKNIQSKYIVYAENEVFENTDSFLFGKFNSADFQNQLKVGQTYYIKVVGWRIPFLSMYRNIVKIYPQ